MLSLCWTFKGKQMQKLGMDSLGLLLLEITTITMMITSDKWILPKSLFWNYSEAKLIWRLFHANGILGGKRSILIITLHFPHVYTIMFLISEPIFLRVWTFDPGNSSFIYTTLESERTQYGHIPFILNLMKWYIRK